jgi:hypothetical protein
VEKSEGTRISREESLLQIVLDQELQNVECFTYMGSMIPDDATCKCVNDGKTAGEAEVTVRQGQRRRQLVDDLKETR